MERHPACSLKVWAGQTCIALAIAVFGACSEADHDGPTLVRRDSAGIDIAENGPGAVTRELGPAFDESLGRTIDGLELKSVTAARLLADGRVVLTDNAGYQLVFVDPASGARKTVGRRGPGPEEFNGGFHSLWRCPGDTLVVRSGLEGFKVFDSSGTFVRVDVTPHARNAFATSSDCKSIVIFAPRTASDAISMRDTSTVAWYDFTRDTVTNVLTVPSAERQRVPYLGERIPIDVPFAEDWRFAISNDHIYAGLNSRPEVRVYDRHGRLVRMIRWAMERSTLTNTDKKRYSELRDGLDQRIRPGTTAQAPDLKVFDLPPTKPLFSQLRADDEGYLWVRKFRVEDLFERAFGPGFAEKAPEWWLFAPSGQLLGVVTTPLGFALRDTRGGMAVGLRTGRDGVPQIILYPVINDRLQAVSAPDSLESGAPQLPRD